MAEKKELAVSALRNGTVIDHIPSNALLRQYAYSAWKTVTKL